jgi:uncharacterized membrane protein
MAIAILSLIGVFIAGYMMLFRLGIIGRLACGTGGQCETVQSSPWAAFFGIPVPLIGLGGYVVLLALALVGLPPARAGDRRISLALVGLSLVAVFFTGYLNALEAFVIHAWCRWCLGSAAVIALIFLASIIDLVTVRGRAATFTPEEP